MRCSPPCRIFLALALACVAARASAQQATPPAIAPKDMAEERAKVLMAEKRYDAAIQAYQDLLKTSPKNAVFMNMIGIAYLDLAKMDQAKHYFASAAKADKKYSSAVNNLGMVYYHQKNFRAAIRQYQKAVAIDPNQAAAHSNLGFAYYNSNKFVEAAGEFQKALDLDPTVFERNDRAGAVVQDRSVNNHGRFFFTMARVYAQKGDAAHCAEYLRKSLDEGYKDVAKAATDPAFKDVVNDPAVQEVLVRAAPSAPAESQPASTHPGA